MSLVNTVALFTCVYMHLLYLRNTKKLRFQSMLKIDFYSMNIKHLKIKSVNSPKDTEKVSVS